MDEATRRERKVLFSAMKNEAPFVLEWIAYHKVIGFDEIVICSNPSNDGMEEILAALAEAGEIRHLRVVPDGAASPQVRAAQRFSADVGYREGDWYLWLDGDEFLNIHVGDRTVDALAHAMLDRTCALLNWRVFGSGGNQRFSGRCIGPDFTRSSDQTFSGNRLVKSFFRKSPGYVGFAGLGVHRPLLASGQDLRPAEVVTGNGRVPSPTFPDHVRWNRRVDVGGIARVAGDEVGWDLAQINHYLVRTPEFYEMKRLRGRGSQAGAGKEENLRHSEEFFAKYDRNEEEDRSILAWQDRVTSEMDRLAGKPGVCDALKRSSALVDALLAGTHQTVAAANSDDVGQSAPRAPRKVLFSAMKNEAPFVLEWIAYHKVIGFDEIVICSNPSNDGMEEILAALAEAGEIRHLRTTVAARESPQQKASRLFSAEVGYRLNDWYLWLDADEFLNVHVGDRTIQALVTELADRQFALINWRVFGSAGQARFGGRFVSNSFSRAALPSFAPQLEQKTLFRYSSAVLGFGVRGINRPLLASNSGVRAAQVVVGTGRPAAGNRPRHRSWLAGADSSGTAKVRPEEFGWTLAQINHYMVRTPEFFALKRLRGRGYKADAVGAANQRHTEEFFAKNDRNETEDRSILCWEDRVTAEIARLLRVPSVAEAKRRSDDLVSAVFAQVESREVSGMSEPSQVAAPAPVPDAPAPPAPSFALTFPRREAGLVRRMYAAATNILEYGSGGSTLLGARLGKRIVSVESDRAWADRLQAELATFPAALVHHVYIGPTEKWGMPSRPRYHGRFHRYALSVWDLPDLGEPDLVLIDGRFRAACLAATMLRTRRPTTVLFDDYEDRPHYHGVEKLARKEESVGRMARFTVTPGTIPAEMLTEVIGWFSDPR